MTRRLSNDDSGITLDHWLAELSREQARGRSHPGGATVEQLAQRSGLSMTAIRNRIRKLILAGKWRRTGTILVERIDGRPNNVWCYGPTKAAASRQAK